jgi:ABC-type oligopeptide transport system substrate-binding subunit
MKKAVSLILAIIIGLSCCACGKKGPKNANQTINYNLNEEPQTLDPQIANDSSAVTVIQALYEGLVRLDENNQPYAGVAEKWESNSNHTVFTFHLRKDAQWSNGDSVTAYDFIFAFVRALSPSTKSTTCQSMFCIKNAREIHAGSMSSDKLGVTAEDEYTLVVQLAYPYEEFPALTATTPFMPCNKKFFTSTAGKYGLEAKTTLSNGPFNIPGTYSWEHDDYLKLSRSDNYHGFKKPLPYLGYGIMMRNYPF